MSSTMVSFRQAYDGETILWAGSCHDAGVASNAVIRGSPAAEGR